MRSRILRAALAALVVLLLGAPSAFAFDLALRKTTTETRVARGQLVDFSIEVFNQSLADTVQDVVVSDYLPAGFDFSAADNAGWADTGGGRLETTIPGPVAPGDSATLTLSLRVRADAAHAGLVNLAEVSAFEDLAGLPQADDDSTPDGNPANDGPVVDDQITGPGDEDDHDSAAVLLNRHDLALTKTTAVARAVPGQLIPYTLTVVNQSPDPGSDIFDATISDYVPAGLSFSTADNPGWLDAGGGRVSTVVPGPLAPTATAAVTLNLRVAGATGTGTIVNRAEITGFEDAVGAGPGDIDSTPDVDPDNDPVVDDETGNAGGDQDDHDIAPVAVVRYDLALRKTTASTLVSPGDPVDFSIEVFNQSSGAATGVEDITVADYLPAGFDFSALENTGWADVGGGRLERTIPGPLATGASTTITLRLRVRFDAANAGLGNRSEITRFEDDTGVSRPDVDSTPDTDPDNDVVVNNVIDNSGGDEDDHDAESVRVIRHDLALRKTGPARIVRGTLVDYQIVVINQATDPEASASNVVVSDYVPAGLEFVAADNTGWAVAGPGRIARTIAGPIAPGTSSTIALHLRVRPTATAANVTNAAEITSFQGDGATTPPDTDSTPDANPANDGPVVDDETAGAGGDQDDHDISTHLFGRFDLALRKTTPSRVVTRGQLVEYTLEVFNQSPDAAAAATDVVVTDYVPAGFDFLAADNPGWTASGSTVSTVLAGPIAAGTSATVMLRLRVRLDATDAGLGNRAELSAFEDPAGVTVPDLDSTPDADPDNDGPVVDNAIDGTGGDEDDHDPAFVSLVRFDLALRKSASTPRVAPADLAAFTIDVINQSPDAAGVVRNVTVSDHVPVGLEFSAADNPGWTDAGGGVVTTTIAGPVAPGATTTVTVRLRVRGDATDSGLVNLAEISRFESNAGLTPPDADSIADAIPDNDGTVIDDAVDGRDGDEDDHDTAALSFARFDLALRKSAPVPVAVPGQDVPFDITVFNQSPDASATARNVTVTDYLPAGYDFVAASNPGWADAGGGRVTTTIAGSIVPGSSATVRIILRVRADATTASAVNRAEVSRFEASDATTPPDVDSTPDSDPDNDAFADDVVDGSGGDEDDHDAAGTEVIRYDLALRKTTTTSRVERGDEVRYRIEVFNQSADPGAVARNIRVVDYIPADLEFLAGPNIGWTVEAGARVATTIPGPVAPGQSAAVEIRLRVRSAASAQTIINAAEIAVFTDGAGATQADSDSIPNVSPSDDRVVDNQVDNAGDDEDDHDVAGVINDDAADTLVARTTTLSVSNRALARRVRAGRSARWRVTVRNPGAAAASGVVVCSRLPRGLSFARATPRPSLFRSGRPCWRLGSMRRLATRTITLTTAVARSARGRRTSTATVTANNAATRRARASLRVLRAAAARPSRVTG